MEVLVVVQSLTEIKSLLATHGLRPKHRFGQNFLHDQNLIRKLLEAAGVSAGDLVLEVGPGTGTLTESLLEAGAEVVACELDRDLAAILRERLGERITLIEGDAMERGRTLNPRVVEALGGRPFKLVANLPYQIATSLISALLVSHSNCTGQFVTVQWEVAERLTAKPTSGKEYGPLSIITQAFGEASVICKAPASCFWPPPKVESAMVAITPSDAHAIDDKLAFARFVVEVFMKRRKQLGTIFGRGSDVWLSLAPDVLPEMRPEALGVEQMIALWRAVGC